MSEKQEKLRIILPISYLIIKYINNFGRKKILKKIQFSFSLSPKIVIFLFPKSSVMSLMPGQETESAGNFSLAPSNQFSICSTAQVIDHIVSMDGIQWSLPSLYQLLDSHNGAFLENMKMTRIGNRVFTLTLHVGLAKAGFVYQIRSQLIPNNSISRPNPTQTLWFPLILGNFPLSKLSRSRPNGACHL